MLLRTKANEIGALQVSVAGAMIGIMPSLSIPVRRRYASLMPEGFWIFYLVAPPVLFVLFDLPFVPKDRMFEALLMSYVYTVAIAGSLHLAYAFVLPRLFARMPDRRLLRLGVHLLTIGILVPLARLAVSPFRTELCPIEIMGDVEMLTMSYIVTAVVVGAAVSYQRLHLRARDVERIAAAERQAALTAQLSALQSRTNPHFLFNSLNAVASLIPTDPDRAEAMIERLADVLRYAVARTRERAVSVEEEVAMVKDYLEIESARFGDRLHFEVEVDPNARDQRVPPMMLQPLVENAVLHGIGSRREGGTVRVRVSLEDDAIHMTVSDDGPGVGRSEHAGNGSALADLRARLELIFGRDLLSLGRAPQGGCLAELVLPCAL